jgi:hypothetical protein
VTSWRLVTIRTDIINLLIAVRKGNSIKESLDLLHLPIDDLMSPFVSRIVFLLRFFDQAPGDHLQLVLNGFPATYVAELSHYLAGRSPLRIGPPSADSGGTMGTTGHASGVDADRDFESFVLHEVVRSDIPTSVPQVPNEKLTKEQL